VKVLLEIREQELQKKTAVVPTESEAGEVIAPVYKAPDVDKVAAYLNAVEAITAPVQEQLAILAHEFMKQLAVYFPDTASFSRAMVRCSRRSDYFNEIRERLDLGMPWTAFEIWRGLALKFGEADTTAKVAKTNEANDKKLDEQVGIRTAALRDWSKETLEKCNDWKSVAVALAFVTGRRMSEVMAETEFKQSGDYSVDCKYLSKSKGEETEIESIPTLVPAALVIKAIDWLKPRRNRAQSEVNKAVGKELSIRVKELVLALNIVAEDKRYVTQPSGREVSRFSFHSLRKAYILNAVADMPNNRGTLREAQRLLGHASLSTTNDNYKDVFYLID
jgi:hypothetical protein